MTEKPDNTVHFDDYLQGKLTTEDKSAFKQRLENDESLMLQFEKYREEVDLIKMLGIRQEMKSLLDDPIPQGVEHKKSRLLYLIPLTIAASLSLFLIFRPTNNIDNQSLFEQYFKPYPDAISGRDNQSGIAEAMLLYNEGKHLDAIQNFERLSKNDTTAFYKSLSHLTLNQPTLAIDGFNRINQNSIFYNQARWFKGLSFLLLDQKDSVLASFEKIKAESVYKDLSEQVMDRLK